jgi:hypothetical protein
MQLPDIVLDRSAVLLLGVCAGAAIGLSFAANPGSAGSAVPPHACASTALAADPQPEVTAARQCSAPAQRQLVSTLAKGAPVRVAVFGDSYGDGVWSGLQRQLPGKEYEVLKYSHVGTGFTRYRRQNLESLAAEEMGGQPIDIAVISIGANDAQSINTDKGEYAPLMGPKWQAQIGERLDRYVGLLRAHHAMVYWVGLPRMRDAGLDRDVGAINDFYAQRMAKLGVPFIDTAPIASPNGQYSAYLPDPRTGAQTLVREKDGVHMSMTGWLWITRGLSERIRGYVEATRAMKDAK